VLTSRGIGLGVAAGALWLTARALGVAELQVAAVAAALLVLVAAVATRLVVTRLEVDRVVAPGTAAFGATVQVALTITNRGRLPTVPLELEDHVPSTLTGRSRTRLAPLAPGRRATVRYRLTATHRGRFELGPVEVRARDPFGLAARHTSVPGSTPLTVLPPVTTLPPGLPLGGAIATGRGARPRPRAQGEDTANVREYVRGDDLRAVHWASTAHRGKLMVRHTESREEPRAVLALDLRAERHRGAGPGASEEAAVAAAASIVAHLAARDRGIVLLHRPLTEPPRASERDELLAELAEVRTEGAVELPALLNQIAQGLAGGGTLFAVVTLPEAGELRQLVRAGRGFSTRVALLVDAASHAARPDPAADETAAALRAAGWRVVVLRAGDRLDQRWRDLLTQRRVAVPSGGAAR
jgi:uncharacterized protein (DUF58 family)